MAPHAAQKGGDLAKLSITRASTNHMSYKLEKIPPPSLIFSASFLLKLSLLSSSISLHPCPIFKLHQFPSQKTLTLASLNINFKVGFHIFTCYLWSCGYLEFHIYLLVWWYAEFIWVFVAGLTCGCWVWMGNWVKSKKGSKTELFRLKTLKVFVLQSVRLRL